MSSDQAVASEPQIVEILLKALRRAEEPITAKKLLDGLIRFPAISCAP